MLFLIPTPLKPRLKPNLIPESFRPLCPIDTLGKLYEYLIKDWLEN